MAQYSMWTITIYWPPLNGMTRAPTVHHASHDAIDLQQGPSCLRLTIADKSDGTQRVYYYPWESMDHVEVEMK